MTQPHLNIRWYKRGDTDDIMLIETEECSNPLSRREFLDIAQHPGVRTIVADLDDNIVGYAMYVVGKECITIDTISVRKEFRSRGIGSALAYAVMLNVSNIKKLKGIRAIVLDSNEIAMNFFTSIGMKAVKNIENTPHNMPERTLSGKVLQIGRKLILKQIENSGITTE